MRLARLGSLAVVATLFLACASKDRPPVSDISNTGEVEANKCAATEYASRQRILMLIVLDGSGSMASDHKWDSVVPALDSFFDDLKTQADSAFAVGLTIFSDKNDMQTGAYSKVDVPIGVVDAAQAGALRRRIDQRARARARRHSMFFRASIRPSLPSPGRRGSSSSFS